MLSLLQQKMLMKIRDYLPELSRSSVSLPFSLFVFSIENQIRQTNNSSRERLSRHVRTVAHRDTRRSFHVNHREPSGQIAQAHDGTLAPMMAGEGGWEEGKTRW